MNDNPTSSLGRRLPVKPSWARAPIEVEDKDGKRIYRCQWCHEVQKITEWLPGHIYYFAPIEHYCRPPLVAGGQGRSERATRETAGLLAVLFLALILLLVAVALVGR